MRRYRDAAGGEGGAIVWERLEGYELRWRARGVWGFITLPWSLTREVAAWPLAVMLPVRTR